VTEALRPRFQRYDGMGGWPCCPVCDEDALGSTTYPDGVTFFPDGKGYYVAGGMVEATALMLAGEMRCKGCGWTGRVDLSPDTTEREGSA
jgi:hypothetical protein